MGTRQPSKTRNTAFGRAHPAVSGICVGPLNFGCTRLRAGRGAKAKQSGAFTLIEILVVVATISLLIGMLMPSLGQAREQVRSVACKSNLHQLGTGMTMYLNQWNVYPGHQWYVGDAADTRVRWFNLMAKSLGGYKVQGCAATPDWEVGRNNSYGYNYKYLGSLRDNLHSPTKPLENFPVKAVKAPSMTIAFGDTDGTGWQKPYQRGINDPEMFGNHGYVLDPTYIPEYSMESYSGGALEPFAWKKRRTYISLRHNKASNLCFTDGHVASMTPKQVYQDNRYWNGLGGEYPNRDVHVSFKYLDGEWRFPD